MYIPLFLYIITCIWYLLRNTDCMHALFVSTTYIMPVLYALRRSSNGYGCAHEDRSSWSCFPYCKSLLYAFSSKSFTTLMV